MAVSWDDIKRDMSWEPSEDEVNYFMGEALNEAKKALSLNEIPIGCVIEQDGKIIGRGHNLTETAKDTTAHAEMVAIREASEYLKDNLGWRRLTKCHMYVTMEPCSMCAGALVWSRIEDVVIGVMDPKAGGCGSVLDITGCEKLNHRVNVHQIKDSPLKDECGDIIKKFFKDLRDIKKTEKLLKESRGNL